jgi:PAS domain S-box-containing protein
VNSPEDIPGQLRILLLEDDPSDAELILRAVGNGGITHVSKSVQVRDEFRAALTEFGPDLVLSDYQLSGFNGIDALTIVRERNPDLPFILVTGALGEEFAVETIKRGATDYILKDRLSHLVPAILRAMRETEQRSRRRQAEELVKHEQEKALRESEARMNSILQSAQHAIITIDHQGMIVEFNAAAEKTFGCHRAVVIGKEMALVIIPPSFRRWFQSGLTRSFAGDEGPVRGSRIEMIALRADGTEFPAECTRHPNQTRGPPMFTVFISDITRRNRAEEQIRRLADAVQSTQELISIADHENYFTFVNQLSLDAYGYSESEVLGRTPDFLYSPNNRLRALQRGFQQTVRAGWRGENSTAERTERNSPLPSALHNQDKCGSDHWPRG